jgi:hypothetical protein
MTITTEEAEQMAEICDQLGGFAQCAAALRSFAAERDKAQGYLSRCLQSLYPNIEPLPDLLGVCTQIDNVLAGQKAENARLLGAINAALTEETPMEDGLWSQEPIGPNETPAEAIKRLIKFRVNTGCIVERDAFKDEIEKLRTALRGVLTYYNAPTPAEAKLKKAVLATPIEQAYAALGEKE